MGLTDKLKMGIVGTVGTGIQPTGDWINNARLGDLSVYNVLREMQDNTRNLYGSNEDLLAGMNTWDPLPTDISYIDVGGHTTGLILANMGKSTATGAAAGMAFGPIGAAFGAGVGFVDSGISELINSNKAQNASRTQNINNALSNKRKVLDFNRSASNIESNYVNALQKQGYEAAYGGWLPEYTENFTNGVTFIREGGTHESNPLGGVPIAIAPDGTPDLVEEGEVEYDGYMFSARHKLSKKFKEENNLPDSVKTPAEAAEYFLRESEERPNDPISKRGLESQLSALMLYQELLNAEKEANMLAKGGGLSRDEDYGSSKKPYPNVKSSNFAGGHRSYPIPTKADAIDALRLAHLHHRNDVIKKIHKEYPSLKKAEGGYLFAPGGYLPYDNSKGFAYFNNGAYDTNYLNWLNNTDLTTQPYWGELLTLYKEKFGKDLTLDTARKLGLDLKFGKFHNAFADAYNSYLNPVKTNASNASTGDNNSIFVDGFNPYFYDPTKVKQPDSRDPLYYHDPYTDVWSNPWIPQDPSTATTNVPAASAMEEIARRRTTPNRKVTVDPYGLGFNVVDENIPEGGYIYNGDDSSDSETDKKTGFDYGNLARYAPVIYSGFLHVADLFGANAPDYRNADIIKRGISGIRDVEYKPAYERMIYDPDDINAEEAMDRANSLAALEALTALSSGNRGIYRANANNANFASLIASGVKRLRTKQANREQLAKVKEFNRTSKQADAEGLLKAAMANQSADYLRLAGWQAYSRAREDALDTSRRTRATTRDTFLNNLGALGKEYATREMIDKAGIIDLLLQLING